MKNVAFNTWLTEIISFLLIIVFVYTGLSKLAGHDSFQRVLTHSSLAALSPKLLAWTIPAVELSAAALLLHPFTRNWGLRISLGLMIAFTVYIAYIIVFAPRLPCNCGGVIETLTWTEHLLLNLFLTAAAGLGTWLSKRNRQGAGTMEKLMV